MVNTRLRQELIEGMEALAEVGAVSGATMRQFRSDLIVKPPVFSPTDILHLRERFGVSQAVFAALMNVSLSTVQKWEQGQKEPSAPANKLLQLINEHGLAILLCQA